MATTKQAVQELKSERVQEEIALVGVGDEPFRIWLKAERVQQPSASAVGPDAQTTSTPAFELNLTLSPKQPVKIDLTGPGTTITI